MSPDEVLERTQWDLFWVPPDTLVVDRPELLALSHASGRPELNVVTRTRGSLDGLIEEVRSLHGERRTRWLVVPQGPSDLEAALAAAGFEQSFEAFAYSVDVDRWTGRGGDVQVRRVEAMDDLRACVAVKAAVFGREGADLPLELAQCTGPEARVRRYVAFLDGEPVASAGLNVFRDLSFGFLWAGGTVAAARGRGAYSALVAARIADARRLGLSRVGLYARTDTSAPIVERQGFTRGGPMAYWEGGPTG